MLKGLNKNIACSGNWQLNCLSLVQNSFTEVSGWTIHKERREDLGRIFIAYPLFNKERVRLKYLTSNEKFHYSASNIQKEIEYRCIHTI